MGTSFVEKILISAPVNGIWQLGLGMPAPLIPTGMSLASHIGEANAPGVPFSEAQIGRFLHQPDGKWQSAEWNGKSWTPTPGVFAPDDYVKLLDASRKRLLDLSEADRQSLEKSLRQAFPLSGLPAVSPDLGSTPDPLVKTIRYVDPLILDLDGDGLEITRVSEQVLFDANGDGIKTATAWASADDGLVVWDRNGNGTIDTGAELFGDQTVLADGRRAADGFAALRDLDSNSDGVFDTQDTHFADLRIWRDLNQDGISGADEMRGLADSGVRSIALASQAPTAANQGYADAQLVQDGSFTRTDGSTGQAGSFNLAQNSFVRAFVPIEVSQAASALPAVRGSGWVRDLQEAATLDPALIDLLNAAKNAPTRAGYVEGVSRLMREWGNASVYDSASRQALAHGYGLIMSEPQDDQERGWMDMAVKAGGPERKRVARAVLPPSLGYAGF